MSKILLYSALGGFTSFVASLALLTLEFVIGDKSSAIYISLSIINGIAYGLFIYGFFAIGKKLKNKLLKNISLVFIFITIASVVSSLTIRNAEWVTSDVRYSIALLVMLSVVSIYFGRALLTLQNTFGKNAKRLGLLLIIAGVTIATVLLSVIGIILLALFDILGSLFLLKARKKLNESALQ